MDLPFKFNFAEANFSKSSGRIISTTKNLPEEKKIRLKTLTDDPVKFELINKRDYILMNL